MTERYQLFDPGQQPYIFRAVNIRMDLEEIGINTGNWVDSAQGRDYCECDIEPPGSISHRVS